MKQYKYESDVNDDIAKAIKQRYGRKVWYYKTNDKSRKAILDIILCFYGVFVSIEIKRPDNSYGVQPLQNYNIKMIKEAGGYAFSANNKEDVMHTLENILDEIMLKKANK